jgi:hypothetical protein
MNITLASTKLTKCGLHQETIGLFDHYQTNKRDNCHVKIEILSLGLKLLCIYDEVIRID